MSIDLQASDPLFRGSRPGEGVDELVEYARASLGMGPDRPWRIVNSRQKLKKTLFEVDENGRRIVGKASKSERAQDTFEKLSALWNAGMRPPSKCIVTEPLAWLPERSLLLQRRAEGMQLIDLIRERSPRAIEGIEHAAQWLHALQGLRLTPPPAPSPDLERCRTELVAALPEHASRIDAIADSLDLASIGSMVPSHGDFHPLNVFLAPDGTVTVIDLDTFAAREPAVDTAYCLAQMAIMGHHVLGGFNGSAEVRAAFRRSAPQAPEERIETHIRWAFLRSLHYDLCILRVRERGHVEAFLAAAQYGLE